jgi:uncharacterized protein (TIGR04255 family)
LKRSPLTLVVCQIRHEQNHSASDPKRAVAVHEKVKGDFAILEEQSGQEITISAGPAGVQTVPGASSRGWRMRSEDQSRTAIVMPEFFSVETTRYTDWDDFRPRFEGFARAVHDAVEPSLEQRIGIRMIDLIKHPGVNSPQDWQDWIDPAFLGPISHPGIGPGVSTTQQVLQIDAGDGYSVIVRHGCLRDQETDQLAYLMDHDCFVQRGRPFDVDEALSAAEQLHRLALQIFQSAITTELYEYLRSGQE